MVQNTKTMIKQIQTSKKLIQKLLTERPSLRDSDILLMKAVWSKQIKHLNYLPASELLDKLAKREILNPETIRRCRQKIQEENPSLRGKNYRLRHKIGSETRKVITKI